MEETEEDRKQETRIRNATIIVAPKNINLKTVGKRN